MAKVRAEGTLETRETSSESSPRDRARQPGALLVFAGGRPTCIAMPLVEGTRVALGRGAFGGALDDARASRDHAYVTWREGSFFVEDNGSRNGTFVDAARITRATAGDDAVVRIGQSVILLKDDVSSFVLLEPLDRDGVIVGPTLARAHDAIARAAAGGESMLFLGETGSGKELAAQKFHAATGRKGALVAVNCAAIPHGVAERLLFGAKRGAYSGADADADGYLQAADRGTLFLDEIAELDVLVQAKLLRAIESGEVLPVGASKARKVDVRVCSATHKDLRGEIASGRFRRDLYFRIGRPEVEIPPLRKRREEIPWLVARSLGSELMAHAAFLEACLLRAWPGNVRELLVEVRRAANEARARDAQEVRASDLAEDAGRALEGDADDDVGERIAIRTRSTGTTDEDDIRIRRALRDNAGNVTAAARALGMHRNQVRRWVDKHKVTSDEDDER